MLAKMPKSRVLQAAVGCRWGVRGSYHFGGILVTVQNIGMFSATLGRALVSEGIVVGRCDWAEIFHKLCL